MNATADRLAAELEAIREQRDAAHGDLMDALSVRDNHPSQYNRSEADRCWNRHEELRKRYMEARARLHGGEGGA